MLWQTPAPTDQWPWQSPTLAMVCFCNLPSKVETGFRDNPIQIVFINNKFLIKFNPLFLQKSQKCYTKLQSSESTVGLKKKVKKRKIKLKILIFRL